MTVKGNFISPEDIEFDDEGRAIIADPEIVARLRAGGGGFTLADDPVAHIRSVNIGCRGR